MHDASGTLISHRPNVEDMEAANKMQGLESGMARSLALLDRVESVKASGNLTTEEIYAHLRAIYSITHPADDGELQGLADMFPYNEVTGNDASPIAYGGKGMFGDPKEKKKKAEESVLGLTVAQITFNEVVIPIALAEPTPIGEAIVAVINIVFFVYNNSPTLVMSKNHYNGLTGSQIISNFKKGSIRNEFPEEYNSRTWEEIQKEAAAGNKKAQAARKLLNDNRFNK